MANGLMVTVLDQRKLITGGILIATRAIQVRTTNSILKLLSQALNFNPGIIRMENQRPTQQESQHKLKINLDNLRIALLKKVVNGGPMETDKDQKNGTMLRKQLDLQIVKKTSMLK